jgi:hypothetical protein
MLRSVRSFLSLASAAVLVAGLTGCGGDSPAGPPASPTPPPPPAAVTSVVTQGAFSRLRANFITDIPFTTTATGTLEVRVDWTFADDHIVVYVARGACSFQQLKSDQCTLVVRSESTLPKPRVLTIAGASAADYVLWVGNLGPKEEALSYQVLLTTGGAATSASVEPLESVHVRDFVGADSGQ